MGLRDIVSRLACELDSHPLRWIVRTVDTNGDRTRYLCQCGREVPVPYTYVWPDQVCTNVCHPKNSSQEKQ